MTSVIVVVLLIILALIALGTLVGMILALLGAVIAPVPFVPVSSTVTDALPELLKLNSNSVLYDLGCGNARVLMRMALVSPYKKMIGVEKAPLPYLLARWHLFLDKPRDVTVLYKDIFKVPIADATHIFMYMFPKVVNKMYPILLAELKPGTRVISCDFPFDHKTPSETHKVGSGYFSHTLYVYDF